MLSEFNVEGQKIVASGLCLAKTHDGQILFVDGLLPGENAIVSESKSKGNTIFGKIDRLLTKSSNRVDPPCVHFTQGCGGCDFQHIKVEEQAKYKRSIVVDGLERIAKIRNAEEIVDQPRILKAKNYRTTARVLLNSSNWGFRARNSHEMVPVQDCMVLDENCQQIAVNAVSECESQDVLELQVRALPRKLHGHSISLSDKSFYQSHVDAPELLTNLLSEIATGISQDSVCVDLFSGVGILALAIARTGRKVICVEGNHHAVGDARKNLESLDVQVIHSDVKKFRYEPELYGKKCELVIADPSREGLTKEALPAVLSCNAKNIVLISCDPASGARDISLLRENGYELKKCIPVEMFAYTHHVEMFSVLELVL